MRDGVVSSLPSEVLEIDEHEYRRIPYPLSWRRRSVAAQLVADLSLLDAMVLVSAFLSPVRWIRHNQTLVPLSPSDLEFW